MAIAVPILLGAVFVARALRSSQSPSPDTLRSATIGVGVIQSTIGATGELVAEGEVELRFPRPGTVARLNVQIGDIVSRGEVLAEQEAETLRLALAKAQAERDLMRIALDELKAPPRAEDLAVLNAAVALGEAQVWQASQGVSREEVEIARLNLVNAQKALEQTYILLDDAAESRSPSWSALKQQEQQNIQAAKVAELRYRQLLNPAASAPAASAQAALAKSQAELDRALKGASSEDLRIAELELDQAQALVDQAQADLDRARLIAPFAGVVAAVNVREGELAAEMLPAVVLIDPSHYHMDVSVDEVDVAMIAVDQPAIVALDALPDVALTGRVERIPPTSSIESGVVTYRVRLLLDPVNSGVTLRAGMTATAEVITAQVSDAVLVPNWAVRRDRESGKAFVQVQRGEKIEEVEIELGVKSEEFSQVLSGLKPGDVVVVDTQRDRFSFFGPGQ